MRKGRDISLISKQKSSQYPYDLKAAIRSHVQPASEQEIQTNASEKNSRQWNRSVGQRVITSVIAIPVVLAFVWLGGWFGFAAAIIAVILSVYELHNMMVHEGYHPLIWMSFALSILFLLAAILPQQRLILLEAGLSAALLITLPLFFFRKKLEGAMVDWSLTLAIPVYLGWPLSVFLLLRGFQVGISTGFWWVLTVFLCVWGFDTGAFFAGHFFGRHKLAPTISPAKTWEGAAGGMVLSIAAAVLLTAWPLGVPWYLAILLGILIGIAATLGDLAESLIKRQTHVKDSGHFIPGHGGILDRIDSLLFAVIVVFIFAQLIGKL